MVIEALSYTLRFSHHKCDESTWLDILLSNL